MEQSENIAELAAALAKAQGELSPANKESKNPFFKSTYADLASIVAVSREPLSKHGLCVMQGMKDIGGKLYLVTLLAHSSGQWVRSEMPLYMVKPEMQSMGSAITLGRRYSRSAMVGITSEDDDGNAASGRSNQSSSATPMTQEQYNEIYTKFNLCDKEFQDGLLAHMSVKSISYVTQQNYSQVMSWILSHLEPKKTQTK